MLLEVDQVAGVHSLETDGWGVAAAQQRPTQPRRMAFSDVGQVPTMARYEHERLQDCKKVVVDE